MPRMFEEAKSVYLATRKRHDQLFNTYVMRPIAAFVVSIVARTDVTPNQLTLVSLGIFVLAAMVLALMPDYLGGVLGVLVLEASYLFDCADGMLARHKKIASKEGHLFDFFTDEMKAVLLVGSLGVRLYRGGGLGLDLSFREPNTPMFLAAGLAGVIVISQAISLTNFVRRPELTGKETPVEAHYETVDHDVKRTPAQQAVRLAMMFLQFLGHYPSHLMLFAIVGRLDLFFWIYVLINLAYLGRGWLGIILRFGAAPQRAGTPDP
jgi:phosphatidylglycerophosphate synthase